MGIGRDGAVRRQLRTLFNVGAVRELTDGQLLERFATERGEAAELAFAVLVERHGPMVLRVCRGALADAEAAQDAFQATFLVLVRRARGLWVRDSIGPWLHQVAYRTAACARAAAARRRRLERRAAVSVEEARPERDVELERLLHEEIDRLPDRYRSPIVLCDLEGRTYDQAARSLGWPVGTVKSRLSRGRDRLRDRLIRRGVAETGGPLAVVGVFRIPAVSIPPGLLDATTAAALRFAAAGPAVRGSAVTLAEGVLHMMTMTRWWKVAAVLVVAGATASGAGWIGGGGEPAAQAPAAHPDKAAASVGPIREVKRGKLTFVRSSRGTVETNRAADLTCNVENGSTIVWIVPEGRRVKKGDVVARLDSTLLETQLPGQRITTRQAEAGLANARLEREAAEIALKEYREGILPQEMAALDRSVAESRATIGKIEERLERTRKASEQLRAIQERNGGARDSADIVAGVDLRDRLDEAELSRVRERRAVAEHEGRRDRLARFTGPRTIKALEGEIEKARSVELARQATRDLEKSKEGHLERQIARCTLVAPIEGHVVYASSPPTGVDPDRWRIEEGATVQDGQTVITIVDIDSPMRINLSVPEPWVDQLSTRMKARVKIDAFADATLDGEIIEIAPRPDMRFRSARNIKIYPTLVQLSRSFAGLRPGMTAEGEILLGEREDAIGVPVGAVVLYDGTAHVALNRPDGGVEWRDVVLGIGDDQIVEVKEGLREGDQVILAPTPYLGAEQRARMNVPMKTARTKAAARRKEGGQPAPPR